MTAFLPASCRGALALALVGMLAGGAIAREEIPAETREVAYPARLAACDSPGVLGRVQSKFRQTEARFWQSEAEIVEIRAVREIAFRPHGLDLIPRRYCRAEAVMADRRRLKLHFAVIEYAGIIGFSDDVQFCLEGYDRNLTAEAGCRRMDR